MSQVLRPDKIGQLTHSAGNIIMAASAASPAYLTVGGRQYKVVSQLSVALPTLAANNRYQVFAVVSGGNPILVISQNENSVGPAGFASWKLVGSFYANGLVVVGFGGFVNIEGVPQTELINSGLINITSTGVSPTKPTSTVFDEVSFSRFGQFGKFIYRFRTGASTAGGANGTGNYLYQLPSSLFFGASVLLNTTATNTNDGTWRGYGAGGITHDANTHGQGTWAMPYDSNKIRILVTNNVANTGMIGLGWYDITLVNTGYFVEFEVPISGWSNTPIKDL
jgi:hypothetical protein